MARVRGPRLPGCLALAALFSLVHSQHGKGGAGSCDRLADCGVGLWAGGLHREKQGWSPDPHHVQLREGPGRSGPDRQ